MQAEEEEAHSFAILIICVAVLLQYTGTLQYTAILLSFVSTIIGNQSNHSSRQEKTTLLDRMKKEPPVQDTWQEDRPGSSDHTLVCHCLSIFSFKYTQVN